MAFNTKLTNKYSRFYNGTARGSSRAKRRTIILSSKGIISALIIFFIIGFILSTQFWRIFYECTIEMNLINQIITSRNIKFLWLIYEFSLNTVKKMFLMVV